MDEAMRRGGEASSRHARACASCWPRRAAASSASVNQGTAYVRIAPHEERTVSLGRVCARASCAATPWPPSAATTRQRDVMQEVRRRLREVPRPALLGAQRPLVQHRRRQLRHRLRHPRPRPRRRSRRYGETPAASAPARSAASSTPTPRSSSTSPSCASRSTASAPPTSASTPSTSRTALRLMVGGDEEVSRFRDPPVNEDYDVQLRLAEGDRSDPGTISRLYVPRQDGGGLVRLDNVVQDRAARSAASRIDRSTASARYRLRASVAPGYALADRLEALRERRRRDEPAGRLHHRGRRARPRARAHLRRVPLGLPALGRLHVHDPGLAVREPDPPADDPALAAALGAVRAALALAHRQHAQPLLRPRHPRALRRGEEELDPADRPHEQPARPRHGAAAPRSCRATATGCGRS